MTNISGGDQESGMSKLISGVSKSMGVMAAGLATPPVFAHTKGPVFRELAEACGPNIAKWLTLGFGGAEACFIYFFTALLVSYSIVWLITYITLGRS